MQVGGGTYNFYTLRESMTSKWYKLEQFYYELKFQTIVFGCDFYAAHDYYLGISYRSR